MGYNIQLTYSPMYQTKSLWISRSISFNDTEICKITFEKEEKQNKVLRERKPSLECGREDMHFLLQSLVDLAWKEGIRPSAWDYEGPAQKEHLDSLKGITDKLLDYVTSDKK